jgi:hypothetical protein
MSRENDVEKVLGEKQKRSTVGKDKCALHLDRELAPDFHYIGLQFAAE